MEYHKDVSELEVVLDRYTLARGWLLHCWNYGSKREEMGRDAVHEQMEVEYYGSRSRNHHLAVVRLIRILSFLCGCDRGE